MTFSTVLVGSKRIFNTHPILILDGVVDSGKEVFGRWYLFSDVDENYGKKGELVFERYQGRMIPPLSEELLIDQLEIEALSYMIAATKGNELLNRQILSPANPLEFVKSNKPINLLSRLAYFGHEDQLDLLKTVANEIQDTEISSQLFDLISARRRLGEIKRLT